MGRVAELLGALMIVGLIIVGLDTTLRRLLGNKGKGESKCE